MNEQDTKSRAPSLGRKPRGTRDLPRESDARLELVLEEYGAWLKRTVARVCPRDMGIALEDVRQDVAFRLWRALDRESEIENLPSYIKRIVVTATIDAMRVVRARREIPLAVVEEQGSDVMMPRAQAVETGASPERAAETAELMDRVGELLARLPENRCLAVRLYFQGFNSQEIADLCGWSEPKARNLLYRGLKRLREDLRQAGIVYAPDQGPWRPSR